jgi:hypothetical protein
MTTRAITTEEIGNFVDANQLCAASHEGCGGVVPAEGGVCHRCGERTPPKKPGPTLAEAMARYGIKPGEAPPWAK